MMLSCRRIDNNNGSELALIFEPLGHEVAPSGGVLVVVGEELVGCLQVEADAVLELLGVAVLADASLGEGGADANELEHDHADVLDGEEVAVVIVRAEAENGDHADARVGQVEKEHAEQRVGDVGGELALLLVVELGHVDEELNVAPRPHRQRPVDEHGVLDERRVLQDGEKVEHVARYGKVLEQQIGQALEKTTKCLVKLK